ncbi:recombinase family protein [Paraburkholderia sp. JHI2823]|uniref:recombinase family protein n=1 Tax=Paraburkholderia sp. JHI2823 TaxID=3112960 RepID=UPI0031734B6B
MVHIVAKLEEKGIDFESIAEKVETSSATGKLAFHVFAALAELEHNLIRERAGVWRRHALGAGPGGGGKPKSDAERTREIKRLMSDPTIPVSQIVERYNVSRTTICKARQEAR